ncbi:MAG: cupin domain-containing protein [Bryobacteraceae bacterium]|nr:cupin domain-containing protein [Bryobacteraceae bacterium]
MFLRLLFLVPALAVAADPTFLRRDFRAIQPQPDDLTANAKNAEYRPAFGIGDKDARQVKGIARYGELTVGPGGESAVVSYPAEEQIYYILEGAGTLTYGTKKAPIKAEDFMYLPPGVAHGVVNTSDKPLRLLVMGYKIPKDVKVEPPADLMIANAADVPLQVLPGHGPTTQFKLLMGTTKSTRDKLAAASQMVSLFIMDFAPGGTNIPHHHEMEEEIYYVLRGSGEMVAGGGADGNEGRYRTKQGEVWFIRLNATVGFYSAAKEGEPHDQVLAVRSTFPFPRR